MKYAEGQADPEQGIAGVLLANRSQLIRFLTARGAGDAAEDVFQELWMRLADRPTGPIADPLSYLYRAANNLMVDRYRSARQAHLREQAWGELSASDQPSTDTLLMSREQLTQVQATIDALGERSASIFRSFRLEGKSQRNIAVELGISLSTVESDLRKTYGALVALRRQLDEQ